MDSHLVLTCHLSPETKEENFLSGAASLNQTAVLMLHHDCGLD